jgi:hypothetical protein
MIADSSENCRIGESPMFRCIPKGETRKVTQVVKCRKSVFQIEVLIAAWHEMGAIPKVPVIGESRKHVSMQSIDSNRQL